MELQQKPKTDPNGLIPPYGGELKNLIIKDKNWELLSKKLTKAKELRSNFIN